MTTSWAITLTSAPAPTSLLVRPMATTSGSQGVVTIAEGAGHDQVVQVSSSHPSLAAVPSSVSVSAGSGIGFFNITTLSVTEPTAVTIWVSGGGVSLSHPLTLYPSLPALTALTVNPGSVVGGSEAIGTVTLGGPAPPNGVAINLASNLPLAASVPKSVVVVGGNMSAQFVIKTFPIDTTTVQLSAAMDNVFQFAALSIAKAAPAEPPPAPAAPSLISPANDAKSVPQPVRLDWSDVANAANYEVQVDNTSTIAAPFVANPTVSVSEAILNAGLPAQRLWWRVRARNSASVFGPFSATRRFTPASSSTTTTAALSSVTLSPSSVVGGNSSTGTVTLTSAAPSGGSVVSLSSSSTTAAVPSSVTITAGAASATFAVTTSAVSASISATISAAYGGDTRTATLTVTPPGQAATLTVTATGRSGERVMSNPAGINVSVGTTGSASFTTGTSIALSVTNGRDAIWSGACSSGGNKTKTCTFALTSDASVTANVQ